MIVSIFSTTKLGMHRLDRNERRRTDTLRPCSHDDKDKKLIPIDKVLNKFTYIGVSVEEDGGIWLQQVDKAVHEFAFGPIAEGLSLLATNNISRMLSSNAGQRQIVEG